MANIKISDLTAAAAAADANEFEINEAGTSKKVLDHKLKHTSILQTEHWHLRIQ